MSGSVEARLQELGIILPEAPAAAANYVPAVISGGMLYVSGQLPFGPDGLAATGMLGNGVSIEQGHAAARICAINIVAQASFALGSLDRVARIVKLVGFVASAPGFTDMPKVVNGASDLLIEVFGDRGRHARSSIGVAGLPLGAAVEVEAVIEIA